jgi:hypothetical protein
MRRRQAPQGFWRPPATPLGLVSIAIVEVGGPDAALWPGMTYMLIAPLQMLNGRVMGGRIRQATTTSPPP